MKTLIEHIKMQRFRKWLLEQLYINENGSINEYSQTERYGKMVTASKNAKNKTGYKKLGKTVRNFKATAEKQKASGLGGKSFKNKRVMSFSEDDDANKGKNKFAIAINKQINKTNRTKNLFINRDKKFDDVNKGISDTVNRIKGNSKGSGDKDTIKRNFGKHERYNELKNWKGTPEFNKRLHIKNPRESYYYTEEDFILEQ